MVTRECGAGNPARSSLSRRHFRDEKPAESRLRPGLAAPLFVGLVVGCVSAIALPQTGEEGFFISGDFTVQGQVVKGVPYQANAITKITQTLPTGAQIATELQSTKARDALGRTRYEQTIGPIGPWAIYSGEPGRGKSPTVIVIQDPVKQMNYVLDPQSHLARYSRQEPFDPALYARQQAEQKERANRNEPRTERTESLGKKKIEGVEASGTRTVTTFPVGSVRNSAPLEIVLETWYSPELKVVVLGKRNDPRVGEITYRLIDIKRRNPDSSLFEVPGDYRLEAQPTRQEEPRRKE